QVTAPPGRPVVVGVTPGEVLTSAFVVQVVSKLAAPAAKGAAFEFRKAPWKDVLAWLSQRTGKNVIAVYKPTGTFTSAPPPGKSYTDAEVIDILNEALAPQKFNIVRGVRALTLIRTDEKVDGLGALVRPEELQEHARTELITLLVPLATLKAGEVAPEVKK